MSIHHDNKCIYIHVYWSSCCSSCEGIAHFWQSLHFLCKGIGAVQIMSSLSRLAYDRYGLSAFAGCLGVVFLKSSTDTARFAHYAVTYIVGAAVYPSTGNNVPPVIPAAILSIIQKYHRPAVVACGVPPLAIQSV